MDYLYFKLDNQTIKTILKLKNNSENNYNLTKRYQYCNR